MAKPMPAHIAAAWESWTADHDSYSLDALVRHYDPLARYLARKALAKAPPWQDPDDMISFAHHGLLDALNKFDPSKDVKFETYATRRISGAIIDWQRRMDPLTRNDRRAVKNMEMAFVALEVKLEREPTQEELAEEMEVDLATVKQLFLTRQSLQGSLDHLLEQAGAVETGVIDGARQLMSDHAAEETNLQVLEVKGHLAKYLRTLSEAERAFVLLHYGEDMSQRDASEQLGMAEPRGHHLRKGILSGIVNAPPI